MYNSRTAEPTTTYIRIPRPARDSSPAACRLCRILLILIVLPAMAGWTIGCSKAPSPEPLIEYHRSGGFVGLDDRLVIQRSGETVLTRKSERQEFILDSDAINRLQALFEEAAFSRLRKAYLPSRQGSDLFEYVVTYKGHTVRTMDGAVPPSLRPILETLDRIVERRSTSN